MRCDYCGLKLRDYTDIPTVSVEGDNTTVKVYRVCDTDYCKDGMRREIELQEAMDQRYGKK